MGQRKISYIIVTWNNEQIIQQCIDSLFAYSKNENEVIVVDNDSKDATCEVIKRQYGDRVILIETGANLGFSRANNVGLERASGDYIFFVNPDVIFIEDIVDPMIEKLEGDASVGIVSPRLLYEDGSFQVSSCNFPSAKKVFWDDCHFYRFLSKEKQMKLAQAQYQGTENRLADWTYGAAHLCRQEDVRKVGGYPDGYFMYGEDTEFCMSFLHQLGKTTYYMGECSLIHLGGYSEKQVLNSKKIVYGTKAAMYFVNKYYGKGALFRYRVILFAVSFFKYVLYSVKGIRNQSQGVKNNIVKWKASWETVLDYHGEQN